MARDAWLEIDESALIHNFTQVRGAAKKSEIACCVKADAYGHGLVRCAEIFSKAGADYLCVATLEEAEVLRRSGIKGSIILLGAFPLKYAQMVIELNLVPIIFNLAEASALADAIKDQKAPPHPYILAIETGMGRLGFSENSQNITQIEEIYRKKQLIPLALHSHFARAEVIEDEYTNRQIDTFLGFRDRLLTKNTSFPKLTMANSAGIFNYPKSHFDIVRPGIALYGGCEFPGVRLKPAMSVKAKIISIRKVHEGFRVSYGANCAVKRYSTIGVIPIGYGDGLSSLLANKLEVLVCGTRLPVLGRLCMDMCMVDLTDVPRVRLEEEVVIIGSTGDETITAKDIADKQGAISYEVLTSLGVRLPKVYVNN